MPLTRDIEERVRRAAQGAADPPRAARSLERLLEACADPGGFLRHLPEAARLFSASQFLANFSVTHPGELLAALGRLGEPVTREGLRGEAARELALTAETPQETAMESIRLFKKRTLLRITLRDLLGETDFVGVMEELSFLAEAVLERALFWALKAARARYGDPSDRGAVSLIALGKLGGVELNYSSDLDLMAVYDKGGGQTGGVVGPTGVRMNRISDHEFYVKVLELLTRSLSAATGEGVAYRVDLRLRPQGQRGELALPLASYRSYYESWGRTWERMALIRARPVAGEETLGRGFMEIADWFVWRRGVDYEEIEEIRALKKKIDSRILRDDIKRGYGGIREAEFFVQTFQLIYGAENRALRTYRLTNAIQGLRRMRLVPDEDLSALWHSYVTLRRVEHFLQMKDDLQTHSLPGGRAEREALARNMGFSGLEAFLRDLRVKRMQIKSMYTTLLGTAEDVHAEALALLEGDLGREELRGFLSFRGVKDPEAALGSLTRVRRQVELARTHQERSRVRRVAPLLLEGALSSLAPDRALQGLEGFFSSFGLTGAYLTALAERRELRDGMVALFALSSSLSRTFLSDPLYLNELVEEMMPIRKTLARMREELGRVPPGEDFAERLVAYRTREWLRLGMFFLSGVIGVRRLELSLSHVADAVLGRAVEALGPEAGPLSVIAMGKLGGREITYGGDLDLLFVSPGAEGYGAAEKVLKTVTRYTGRGILYEVDMRLRPDGTRGVLVKDLAGFRRYYHEKAHGWEIQALLKARPAAGQTGAGRAFLDMAREALMKRGGEVRAEDIRAMRERIVRELSREAEGVMDLKLGPGGLEEVEFFVQGLALAHAGGKPRVLVQNTLAALHRLARHGLLKAEAAGRLAAAYAFMRRLQTFLRLNESEHFEPASALSPLAARFMGRETAGELALALGGHREAVLNITHR
ncbi:MAG: bifunctional [glutamate--ammonia ligase]-adenylyl-L-tyrosine phosphorylase/[glutamate--ammonia-ligase] adenylyltransferase [Nitrospirota bacterium]